MINTMQLFWMEQLQFARPHTSLTATSLHLKSQRCDHQTTRKISKNKPILFDIHQTLNAIDVVTDSLLHLPLQFRNGFRFPSSSGNSVVLSLPEGSCVSCSVSDWLWPLFTADAAVRGKHTLSWLPRCLSPSLIGCHQEPVTSPFFF